MDLAPAEVYATPLDEGRYLCSERTMYRVLARAPGNARAAGSAPAPYDLAEGVNVPMFVLHGTEDERCPLRTCVGWARGGHALPGNALPVTGQA